MSLDRLAASALCGFAKLLTGVRALWIGSAPDARPRVYFANHRSHGMPRAFHRLLRLPTQRMAAARRITKPLAEIRKHRLQDIAINGRRRVVIEIDGPFHPISSEVQIQPPPQPSVATLS